LPFHNPTKFTPLLGDFTAESLDFGGLKCSRHRNETSFYWRLRFAERAIAYKHGDPGLALHAGAARRLSNNAIGYTLAMRTS